MNKILIIYPHFPPSNLAGVHRSRLFAQHLPSFGWEPVILTVHEKYYEEKLDWNLHKLLPANLRIEKVRAIKNTRPRLIGDIGLRAFFQLYKRGKQLIKAEHFDFLYIPIPSFYCALLGRWLHKTTGIQYGIDYIDPWVHHFPGSDKVFSRHWFSKIIAGILEPIAVKKASLITGVGEGYYSPVLQRNPHLAKTAVTGAMPYGAEQLDHVTLAGLSLKPYLFSKKAGVIQVVYAGAMLPRAYEPLELILKSIHNNPPVFEKIEFHFIGTGKIANDSNSYNIKPLAQKYGLWQTRIFEYPARIPYLDVLIHLDIADAILILGSTEPHYTPSKIFQGVLSKKPLIALLHKESTAVNIIRESGAGLVLDFNGPEDVTTIEKKFGEFFTGFMQFAAKFDPGKVNRKAFEKFSARNITGQLVELLKKSLYQ